MKKSNLGLGFLLCLSILVSQQANGLRPIRDTSRSWGDQVSVFFFFNLYKAYLLVF